MKQIYARYLWLTLSCTILFFISCDGGEHPVPNVPVNIVINTDLPLYQPLKATGGTAYVEGGSRGIVIYNNFDNIVALDRHGTFNSSDPNVQVMINPENQFELIDTISGSKYSILSGVVIEGPAEYPLRAYNTTWDGFSNISIFN